MLDGEDDKLAVDDDNNVQDVGPRARTHRVDCGSFLLFLNCLSALPSQ